MFLVARPARVPERSSATSRSRARCSRSSSCSSRGRWRVVVATAVSALPARARSCSAGRACAGRCPVVLATFPVIAGVAGGVELFNIVFFAVLLSTVAAGRDLRAARRAARRHHRRAALPRPLTEAGTIRRLGAEVVEFPIGASDAVVGVRVRDLGLPREALVNVIVRGEQAIPPRGSTRLLAGDELHLLVRQRRPASRRADAALARGAVGPPPRPRRVARAARRRCMSVRPYREGWSRATSSRPRGGRRRSGGRPVAVRRETPWRARRARRRALRGDRAARGGRRPPRPDPVRDPPHAPAAGRVARAAVAAERHRRRWRPTCPSSSARVRAAPGPRRRRATTACTRSRRPSLRRTPDVRLHGRLAERRGVGDLGVR